MDKEIKQDRMQAPIVTEQQQKELEEHTNAILKIIQSIAEQESTELIDGKSRIINSKFQYSYRFRAKVIGDHIFSKASRIANDLLDFDIHDAEVYTEALSNKEKSEANP